TRRLAAAKNPLPADPAAVSEADHQLAYVLDQPLVGAGELHVSGSGYRAVRVQQAGQQRPPLGLGGAEVLRWNVLVIQHGYGPEDPLHRAVAVPARLAASPPARAHRPAA